MVLADALFSNAGMAAAFDDAALVRHALAFERALAEAEASLGLIPHASAVAIGRIARFLEGYRKRHATG